MTWVARRVTVDDGLDLDGWHACAPRLFRPLEDDGRRLWLMNPPAVRRWTSGGALAREEPSRWWIGGSRLTAETPGCEVDFVEMGAMEADAFRSDRSRAMTVLGSFAALLGPESLGRFMVGGRILDTNSFLERRCPSEQTALSLYRVARLRGGAFWDGAADHIAEEVRLRVETAPTTGPIHDLWGRGETHVRFLTDGWRLLLAQSERVPGDFRWVAAAARAEEMLNGFAIPFGGGTWYLHDSLERAAGRNDQVLNTHAHAMAALLAAARPLCPAARALDFTLAQRSGGRGGLVAAALAAADGIHALAPRRWWPHSAELRARAHRLAAEHRRAVPYLQGPLGHLARDVAASVAPTYYLTVNLHDLGALCANGELPGVSRALRAGLRYARTSGYFHSQLRSGEPLAAMVPITLAEAGHPRRAARAADTALAGGIFPAPGWPGYEDQPWSRLRRGTG